MNDSTFTVRIEIRITPKGTELSTIEENYPTWVDADTAYEAYKTLATKEGSRINHVELIEHRKTITHKAATKAPPITLIPPDHSEAVPSATLAM